MKIKVRNKQTNEIEEIKEEELTSYYKLYYERIKDLKKGIKQK